MGLHLRQGDMVAFLRYVMEAYQSFAKSKDIRLHFLSEMEHFHMDFDAEKLQDLLGNLLSNAVKFSPPGSEVWVKCKAIASEGTDGAQWLITVKDNGPGIAEEALAHIFDRFFQADSPEGQGLLGSGIGLSLARELVELMGGKITVESKLGTGTVFHIFLPVSRSAPAMEQSAAVQIPPIEIEIIEPLQPAEHAQENSEKPLCLVVDDNADVADYLKTLLQNDYAVSIAYDGQQGIEKALETLPDVIISDVMMPEKDGLQLCDFLKNDERTSHIPIVLLTAKASVEDRLEGLRRGADAYLKKPFNQEELFICLKKSVELRQRLLAHFSKITPQLDVPANQPELAIEDAFLQKARKAVEEHLADDSFDIHQLCRLLAMSRAQLHRKLTALTGRSASHFIRSIRLHRAKILLASTDQTVAEIAYEVGFRDPNYFTRTFMEEFGVAPSGMRK
jgi:CheY-like chemotaxis protein/two-component sensor histidine kinase